MDVPDLDAAVKPKPPRKPRPSELAAKKAKVAKKAKPKAKRPAAKKAKAKKPKVAKTKRKPGKTKAKAAGPDRSERIDMRVTKAEKARVLAKAKRTRRTVTSIVLEAIEKIK
jgi:hypothetical protein